MRPLLILLSILWAPFMKAQTLAIQHVTVIDATGKPAQPDMTVVVERDRIATVGAARKVRIPKGAPVIDGKGKFLIPGLWDMHVHGAADSRSAWSYRLDLANGVVGVREMFGPPDANAWRAKHVAEDGPSPRVYLASPIVDGPMPVWRNSIVASNATEGRQAVAQQKEQGADFIKVYSKLPRDAYFAIADEARARGIPFAGHVPGSVTAAEASDAGQKSMEHLFGVTIACSAQEEGLLAEAQAAVGATFYGIFARAIESYDENKAQYLFARFVKNGTWQCPTLTVLRSVTRLTDAGFKDDQRLKYVPKATKASWGTAAFIGMPPAGQAALKTFFDGNIRIVGAMHRAGVGIVAGTDTMNPYCFPGFSLHDELSLLVEAGLPPMAALQASTKEAARFMGQLDQRGTIEPGKIADLVLLDRDPLADIHNTRSIRAVVLGGKLMPRAALDAMLTEAEASAGK
jgi:imidazolonepropionase-like amidohydrolase